MQNYPQTSGGGAPATTTRPRVVLPVSRVSCEKIEKAGGMELVAAAILDGKTHSVIADSLGVCRSDLSAWVVNQDSDLYREALRHSADVLYDKALETMQAAGTDSMAEVQKAKEIAGIHMRLAGVRNHHFSNLKGTSISLAPAAPAAPPSFRINVISNGNPQTVIIGDEPGDVDLHDPD